MDNHNSGSVVPTDDSIDRRILDIIVEHSDTPREKIVPDTRLFDLTDSLGVTEIIMALEDEFEGSIPDEAASSIETVGQLTDHVKTHLAARAVGGQLTQPLLHASDVHFAYAQAQAGSRHHKILRGVSVSLAAGEVVALLGPNGSGKSTLLRVLLGQLPAAAGAVAWDGRAVAAWPRRELARRVAYLPQSPTAEPDHRVLDVLRLGRAPYWRAFGLESPRDAHVVEAVAAALDLSDLLDRPMDRLSGGQRQRVFLGRCLAQEPAALLLDEPTTFLDLRHQVELLQRLKRLAREQPVGVLMASHDLNLAAAFADRAVLLDEGTVAAEGSPGDVLREDVLSQVYGVRMRRVEDAAGRGVVVPEVGNGE